MSTDNSSIVDRINNLLKLASNNPNEHERSTANRLAQKLISKFQISQSDLEDAKNKEEDPYICSIIFSGHKARIGWKEKIINKVCNINGCFHLINNAFNPRDGVTYTAYGKTSSVKIVEVLILHIINQVEWLGKNTPGIKGKTEITSFKLGCAQKICERLEEGKLEAIREYMEEKKILDETSSTALTKFKNEINLSKQFAKSLGVNFKVLKPKALDVKSINAFGLGKIAGEKVDLNKPNKAIK